MAVVLETTLGDITIDLYIDQRPKACLNFLKLCKIKYYNFNLFHTVNQGFIAQTGDPTGSRNGGESIWGVMDGPSKRYFEGENSPRIKHTRTGLVSFVGDKDSMIGSQFFITLADDLTYLDAQHCVFGEVAEGFEILRLLNEAICDTDHRPYQDIRITHTVVLEDPFPDPEKLEIPDASPEPTAERLQGGRIAPDEDIDETAGKTSQEVLEIIAEKEAKARATILEMIGDIPDAEMAPPENVLFVCKLNPVTNDDDLEIIFSRFGKIKSCEVIRDKKTGDSLQYAFVEFEEQKSCEDAYFKMDNVLIDDRRIHVDFSQSVAKVKWHGKGRGVTHYNDKGEQEKSDPKNDIGNGRYRPNKNRNEKNEQQNKEIKRERRSRSRSRSRSRDRNDYETSRERDRPRNYDYRRQNNYRDRYNDRNNYNNYRQMNYRGNNQRFRQNNRYNHQNYSRDRRNNFIDYRRNERFDNRRYRENERFRRSRSRDNNRSRNREMDKEYKRKEYDNVGKHYYEISDEDFEAKKRDKKKQKHDTSNDNITSEDEPVKKSKKSKKKKAKKRKQSSSESDFDSESDHKKSKKKKKSKKYDTDSSASDSDSDGQQKKKSKKR